VNRPRGSDGGVGGFIARVVGQTRLSRLGSLLSLAGLILLVYSGGAYLGWFPGGYASVPAPEALSAGERSVRLDHPEPTPQVDGEQAPPVSLALDPPVAAASAPVIPSPTEVPSVVSSVPTVLPTMIPLVPTAIAEFVPVVPTEIPVVAPTPTPSAPISLNPADQTDRGVAPAAPLPGVPVRLVLESIGVDTEVQQGGLKPNQDGDLEWETLPFVAVNYQQLGPVGRTGNPVIAGHVVTRFEGNVFRDLYKVELGAPIEVYTDQSRFNYQVDEIKLVSPDSIEVMAPTQDARLTLITCGGTFDPRSRSFSDRLVVVGKLVSGERL
jgi:LPXTG-site transpeptidase (sortase) family protein